VPGTFDAYMVMLRDYGTMRIGEVLAPAIGYWLAGHPLVERASATIATVADNFRTHWPTSAAVYLPGNKVPAPASLFCNAAVGNTYARILKEAEAGGGREAEIERARKAWSQGFVAEAIDRFYTNQEIMDGLRPAHKGLLRGDDMAKWQATIEAPLTYDYGRYTVCKAGPWAQSPVTLQQLALLKGFNLDGADPTSADFIHTVVEASKLPSPTARPFTAIRSSSTCRCRRCCRTPTTPIAAS
jgi:Gamma-glutamyltransferase